MDKIITEADLRSRLLPPGITRFAVEEGVTVTPAAREYLDVRGITLAVEKAQPCGTYVSMTRTPIQDRGKNTYVDASTGEGLSEKPEDMTHLRGNLLVPKVHPRIRFRGGLDSLEAKILESQLLASREGVPALCGHLGEVLERVRQILGAEVKDTPLGELRLFGYNQEELRRISHNVKAELGLDHPVPHYSMGELALALNTLRTRVRESELLGAEVFGSASEHPRQDILRELNRLSSGVYILFCRLLAGYYHSGN